MSRNTRKQSTKIRDILPKLTRSVFLSENYNASLSEVLGTTAESIGALYAECRIRDAGQTDWSVACVYPKKFTRKVKPDEGSNDDIEFYKPSLDVIDEVWVTELTEAAVSMLHVWMEPENLYVCVCIQVAFSDGRNDLFRFIFDEKHNNIQRIEKELNNLLPDLKQILEKKYSIYQLDESEQRYRGLFYEDLNPNFIASADGSIKDCNRAFIDLFGFKTRKAALQSNFSDRFTNYMHQVFFWETLERGEKVHNHEMSATTENGDNVYILLKIVASYDQNQNIAEFVGYIQDITQRKKTEVALRKSEERYRSLIETTNDWIWEIDEHFRFTYSSLKIQTILSYEPKSVPGQSIFELMPADTRDQSEQKIKKVAGQQKAFVNQEHAFEDASGDIVIFETSGIPLFNNSGIFQGYRGIAKDITERKKTEKQIAKLNDELENKVIERTKMLQIANKELEAFSYSVSHDLRAPLRSIDGFSQALIEDYESELDETGKNYLSRVRSAAQKMSILIDDMIKLAKVSRTTIEIKQVNLSEIAQSIADTLAENNPGRDADFIIEPDVTTTGDKNLIKVVLQNLIENAWKFTSKKDVAKIKFGIEHSGDETAFYVKDNGAGFDMNYANKLFTPFQRLHKETDFPGTGIGLSTVQRIVHRHLGKIWAEGEPEVGATFYFTLNEKTAVAEKKRENQS